MPNGPSRSFTEYRFPKQSCAHRHDECALIGTIDRLEQANSRLKQVTGSRHDRVAVARQLSPQASFRISAKWCVGVLDVNVTQRDVYMCLKS
jgi:ABC-type phosphate/phosphonate transport system ATPase subunit